MQPPTVREIIKMLKDDGFVLVHTTGDHRKFAKGNRRVIVAGNMNTHVKPGTWASIQRQAGWK